MKKKKNQLLSFCALFTSAILMSGCVNSSNSAIETYPTEEIIKSEELSGNNVILIEKERINEDKEISNNAVKYSELENVLANIKEQTE